MRNILLLAICALVSLSANSKEVKVATFNIRYGTANDGPNAWPNRKAIVADFFNTSKPDIIGMQEVLHLQIAFLDSALRGYSHVGVGREDGKMQGEYAPIFFNKERFSLKRSSTIWLSETPTVVGSVGWDAALTRIATYAVLYDKKAKQELLFVNTHFDHMGQKARAESVKLIKKLIKEQGAKRYIVTGDFNLQPTEEPYKVAIEKVSGMPTLIDSRTSAADQSQAGDKECTFNNFGKITSNYIIDYICVSPNLKALIYKVEKVKRNGVIISDHYPVISTLSYKK